MTTAGPGGRLLLLVRHGESVWNTLGRVQGQHPAPGLTARGRRQAAEAANRLGPAVPDRLLTSDASRARETAAVIGDAVGLVPEVMPLLRERHWGWFQGRPRAEAERYESLLEDGEPLPGGESRRDVADRLTRLLVSAGLEPGGAPVVLVTHGDLIRVAVQMLLGAGPATPPVNGSVTALPLRGLTRRAAGVPGR
jgi:broad specificity phosphatase PhoE